MKIKLAHNFEGIISLENLLLAWQEFVKGKRNKKDVQEFYFKLMDNIILLHNELKNKTYRHGGYKSFYIFDPKPRHIHKADVRDRLLHHAIYRILYPFFDRTFIADSFSCRDRKGTHKAIGRLRKFIYIVSKNSTKTCYVLKCDIKKFFKNINHDVLLGILKEYIPDKNIIWLLEEVVGSFSPKPNIGLPLGNLTSQLLVNIYMNKFDQFIKHKLKLKYYLRFADDFVILSENRDYLESLVPKIQEFLGSHLKLFLHPGKITIRTINSGADFLGWISFYDHRILRTSTKRRMMEKIEKAPMPEALNSYLGLLKHGNTGKIKDKLLKNYLLSNEKVVKDES